MNSPLKTFAMVLIVASAPGLVSVANAQQATTYGTNATVPVTPPESSVPSGYGPGYGSGYSANDYAPGHAYDYAPGTGEPRGTDVAYCLAHFKSHDPASGTYLAHDGIRRPCP